jgi:hypothetical protein
MDNPDDFASTGGSEIFGKTKGENIETLGCPRPGVLRVFGLLSRREGLPTRLEGING